MIIESLSNENGNGIENVTQKVNSRCFKLHRSYCNSFNSSNVGVFFSRVEFCRVFSLTWPAYMQIYWNKRKRLHKKRVQLPPDWFGTPTWPPWRHVKTLYKGPYLSSEKEQETFFFLFQFSRFLLCFFFGGGGRVWRGSSQLFWERRGGNRKIFRCRGGGRVIIFYRELRFKSHQPPLPHKKWTFPTLGKLKREDHIWSQGTSQSQATDQSRSIPTMLFIVHAVHAYRFQL